SGLPVPIFARRGAATQGPKGFARKSVPGRCILPAPNAEPARRRGGWKDVNRGEGKETSMGFRICTIGCGGIATGRHGPSYAAYAAERPDTELAACCDLDEAKAEAFQRKFGFARRYTDLVEMLNTERPDAVCLVAPVPVTCELSCRILEMGYPLLMEKPPGKTIEETDRMMAAAEAAGAPSQVAFNRRHAPLVRELKRLMSETLPDGRIQHIRYEMVRVNRREKDFSTTAIHGIDAARFLAGSDYETVRFHYQELPDVGPGVCNAYMDCTFESGATGHLSFCPVAGATIEGAVIHALDNTFLLRLPMYRGLDASGRLRHVRKGKVESDVTAADVSEGDEAFRLDGFYGENASFFDDIRAGRRPAGDLRNARQSVVIAQCMRERRSEYPGR
ncbi:MAG: Gfo/Idh/MocA family oxidoreductase, partial [Candidatus Brocadiae bacterium]|nr:Gfo/Idh/MocA family oxidoreductase [Candidatus Brocadiia bacterium]